LLEGGVDLQQYGAWESRSLQNKDFRFSVWYDENDKRYNKNDKRYDENDEDSQDSADSVGSTDSEDSEDINYIRWDRQIVCVEFDIRLINISYGPSPKDWIFWFSEPSDSFAGDFWAMLEGEEYWRVFEKGRFLDIRDGFELSRGWYFDDEATGPDKEATGINDLSIPGSWSSEF
jgi:hypothetical protein